MLKRSQAIIATETTKSLSDDEGRNCRGLLFSIIQRAVDDVAIEHRRLRALTFFCGREFQELCGMLGLEAEAVISKIVPASFRAEHTRQVSQRVVAPTSTKLIPTPTAAHGAGAERFMAGESPEEEFAAFVASQTLQELESHYGY
jgi:hypothetical protein